MTDQYACLNTDPKPTRLALAWKEVKWRAYLFWLRWGNRHVMKAAHRMGFHHMKRLHPMGGDPFYRCDWCGMHGTKVEIDPSNALSVTNGDRG